MTGSRGLMEVDGLAKNAVKRCESVVWSEPVGEVPSPRLGSVRKKTNRKDKKKKKKGFKVWRAPTVHYNPLTRERLD